MKRDRCDDAYDDAAIAAAETVVALPHAEPTRRCACIKHNTYVPKYPRDFVPLSEFRKVFDDPHSQLTVSCRGCNSRKREIGDKCRKKKKEKAMRDPSKHVCANCLTAYDAKDMYVLRDGSIGSRCKSCNEAKQAREDAYAREKEDVKLDRIVETGASCEICRRIILMPRTGPDTNLIFLETTGGVVTYNGTTVPVMDFIVKHRNEMETRVLEWDHLPEDEFKIRFPDRTYVPKRGGVAGMIGPMFRRETEKCQQVCILCHTLETIRRYKYTGKKQAGATLAKQQYVDQRKREIGGCQLCGFWMESCLRFFDFDHLNPETKVAAISTMVQKPEYSLDHIKVELPGCRMICRNCHRLVTYAQWRDGTMDAAKQHRENQ